MSCLFAAGHLHSLSPESAIQVCVQDVQLLHSHCWLEHVLDRYDLLRTGFLAIHSDANPHQRDVRQVRHLQYWDRPHLSLHEGASPKAYRRST